MRSKIWFLAAACAVIVFALGLWGLGENEETGRDGAVQNGLLPAAETRKSPAQKTVRKNNEPPRSAEERAEAAPSSRWEPPAEFGVDRPQPWAELVTIQGIVTSMDPCTQTIVVDGITIDVSAGGNFPMYRTYEIGDFVEVTYRETGAANTLAGIEMLQKK